MTPDFNILNEKHNEEFKIQCAIFEHIAGRKSGAKAFNVFICHIYQGRSADDGFFLKMLGVIAGVGDLLVLWRSKCDCGKAKIGVGFLEVKKVGGVQSRPQKLFQGICNWLGVHYEIVRSVEQSHKTLIKWGCQVLHSGITEPDLRTIADKKLDSFNFYKP